MQQLRALFPSPVRCCAIIYLSFFFALHVCVGYYTYAHNSSARSLLRIALLSPALLCPSRPSEFPAGQLLLAHTLCRGGCVYIRYYSITIRRACYRLCALRNDGNEEAGRTVKIHCCTLVHPLSRYIGFVSGQRGFRRSALECQGACITIDKNGLSFKKKLKSSGMNLETSV